MFVFRSWCMFRWSEFCWLGSCTNYGTSTILHPCNLTRDLRHLSFLHPPYCIHFILLSKHHIEYKTYLLILHTFYVIAFLLYLHSLTLDNHFQNIYFYLFCLINFSTLKDLHAFSSMTLSLTYVYPFRILIMFCFSNAFVLRVSTNGAY